jgi:hypothetical protein
MLGRWAKADGREHLGRWPRDRVILDLHTLIARLLSPKRWLRRWGRKRGTPDLTLGHTPLRPRFMFAIHPPLFAIAQSP